MTRFFLTAAMLLLLSAGCSAGDGSANPHDHAITESMGGDTFGVGAGGADTDPGSNPAATGGAVAATGGNDGETDPEPTPECDKPNRLDIVPTVTTSLNSDFYSCSTGCDITFSPNWSAPVQADETGLVWIVEDAGTTVEYDGTLTLEATSGTFKLYTRYVSSWVSTHVIRLDPETWEVSEVSTGGSPDMFYDNPEDGGAGNVHLTSPTYTPGTTGIGHLLGESMWGSLFESTGFCLPE